jgi:hypothetical protein
MFYRQASNQYINEGVSFTLNGVTYPPQWLNHATPEQKQAFGLVEVTASNSPFNPKYYWTGETLDGATLTYTGTPKDLAEVKKAETTAVKATAYSILQPTDYIEIRNLRDATYKPEWITWRNSVLTATQNAIDAIKDATDVNSVEAAVNAIVWPQDPNAPTI